MLTLATYILAAHRCISSRFCSTAQRSTRTKALSLTKKKKVLAAYSVCLRMLCGIIVGAVSPPPQCHIGNRQPGSLTARDGETALRTSEAASSAMPSSAATFPSSHQSLLAWQTNGRSLKVVRASVRFIKLWSGSPTCALQAQLFVRSARASCRENVALTAGTGTLRVAQYFPRSTGAEAHETLEDRRSDLSDWVGRDVALVGAAGFCAIALVARRFARPSATVAHRSFC
eukprot:SAG11_NODE_1095_length_5887_cov_1.491189_1_plen_230_part_00